MTDDQIDSEIRGCVDFYDRDRAIARHFLALGRQEKGGPVALTFTLMEADALLAVFGGEPGEVTVRKLPEGAVPDDPADPIDEGPSPAGLWAYMTEYPEDGSVYLGPADDPESSAYAAPTQEGEA